MTYSVVAHSRVGETTVVYGHMVFGFLYFSTVNSTYFATFLDRIIQETFSVQNSKALAYYSDRCLLSGEADKLASSLSLLLYSPSSSPPTSY